MAEIVLSVDVDAPADVTFAAMTDWARQGEWMLGTSVQVLSSGPYAVGTRLSARTGSGPIAVVDTMEITRWDPPYRCEVRHDGRVVRGTGAFEVDELPGGRSRFTWSEWLDLPLGLVGQYGFLAVRPAFGAGVQLSLRRFARWAASYP